MSVALSKGEDALKPARFLSLDFLRGLSIFGMVLSAIEPYGVFPPWMYHIQNPPPSHELDMTVAGLSWVDLVFPVFIFCMGAAIPFAAKAKISAATALKKNVTAVYVKSVFERFIMLWLFSYLYVFINSSNSFVTISGFVCLFPLYMVFKNKDSFVLKNNLLPYVRFAGLLLVGIVIAVNHYFFNEVISVQRRGIIIFLLAFLYLFGALIWFFTRNNYKLRLAAFGLILCFTLVTQYEQWPVIMYANKSIRWWFNVEYIYFLLLLLPATIVGDILQKNLKSDSNFYNIKLKGVNWWICSLMLFLVVWLCYAFYMRLYFINLFISGLIMAILYWVLKKNCSKYLNVFKIAAYFILLSLIIEPIGGGIKKVPCTIQYCFATCGIAGLLLMISNYVCSSFAGNLVVRVFCGAGKNPLMSYICFDCLVLPLLNVTGLIYLYKKAYPAGYHLLGLFRSACVVFLTMWIVAAFSKRKIFWKA